jgi:Ca2+-binding RTX toxin-like protein
MQPATSHRQGGMYRRTGLVAALTLAALAATPALASAAGTVGSSLGTVTYTGDGGANSVTVTETALDYVFAETGISATLPCIDAGDTATCSKLTPTSVVMNMGAGNDVVNASGVTEDPFTINGEAGNDGDINASGANDTITGGADADFVTTGVTGLRGGNGADTISGGAGDDTLNGGAGIDTENGDDGNDTLHGGGDSDVMNGGNDNDSFFGADGNETINGDAGNDTLRGELNNDDLNGGDGNDRLDGGSGIDDFDGGTGVDRAVYGGGAVACTDGITTLTLDNSANDDGCLAEATPTENVRDTVESVTGSQLADTIRGSCFANTFAGDPGVASGDPGGNDDLRGDPISGCTPGSPDFMGGGEGSDTLLGDAASGAPGIDTVTYGTPYTGVGNLNVVIDGGAVSDDGMGNTAETIGGTVERIIGNNGGDTLDGTAADQRVQLFGRNGNDALTDSAFDDLLDGEGGTDTVNCTNGGIDSYRNAETVNGSCEINLGGGGPPPETPTNVVVIYSDDQRYDSMGLMPETTALLGDEAVKFENAYATTPSCCPSRASLYTGQYAPHNGVFENGGPHGPDAFDTSSALPVWLDDGGYRTALVGKYMNGYACSAPIPPGWDEWRAFCNAGRNAYFNYSLNENGTINAYGSSANPDNYSTRVLTERAVSFIESTPDDDPFFLSFVPYAPHEPSIPDPQDASATVPPYAPSPNYNEADVSDKPEWVQDLPLVASETPSPATRYRDIARTLLSLDRSVGTLIDTLEDEGRLDDTMIIFMGDNGMSLGNHRWYLHDGDEYGARSASTRSAPRSLSG